MFHLFCYQWKSIQDTLRIGNGFSASKASVYLKVCLQNRQFKIHGNCDTRKTCTLTWNIPVMWRKPRLVLIARFLHTWRHGAREPCLSWTTCPSLSLTRWLSFLRSINTEWIRLCDGRQIYYSLTFCMGALWDRVLNFIEACPNITNVTEWGGIYFGQTVAI